ncbi:MAG TPA: PIN domain-containing protein [Hymenobacter sp.]
MPARTLLSVVVAAELEVFALRAKWLEQKRRYLQNMRARFPPIEITDALIPAYAHLDAYSQGHLPAQPLPPPLTARNMGKNDLWIAATALYFDTELHTADNDFDHLIPVGLKLVKQ